MDLDKFKDSFQPKPFYFFLNIIKKTILPACACFPLFFLLHTSEKKLCASLKHAPVVGSSREKQFSPEVLQDE